MPRLHLGSSVPRGPFALALILAVSGSSLVAQDFVDETVAAGLDTPSIGVAFGSHGQGAATADFDMDGDLDLVIPGLNGTPVLYFENDGNARFTDRSAASGLPVTSGLAISAHAGDIDNDGDPDLIIGRMNADSMFINDGTGHFTEESFRFQNGSPGPTYSASFGDIDLDGDLDIALGVWSPAHSNRLYLNDGDGMFTDITVPSGVGEFSMTFVNGFLDYDEDGYPDLYCANDKGAQLHPNSLYRNQGNNRFIDMAPALGADAGIFSMGLDHADVFNDGGTDIFVTDGPPDYLFQHWENGQYVERQADFAVDGGVGYTGWGCVFMDYNNDGWLDIYAVDEDNPNPLYENPGVPAAQLTPWTNVTTQVGAAGSDLNQSAFLCGDWDNSGTMDVLLIFRNSIVGEPLRLQLLMNRTPAGPDNHWIKIETEGTQSNRDGQGTQIAVFTNGVRQRQQVRSSTGLCGTNDTRVHFGLGQATTADRIELTWPSGQRQVLYNVAANQILHVTEPQMVLSSEARVGTQTAIKMECPLDANSHGAILLASSANPATPLGNGRFLPITVDGLTAATLEPGNGVLSGNFGLLTGSGLDATLVIPADPSLVGVEFFSTGLTFTPGQPDFGTTFPRALSIVIAN